MIEIKVVRNDIMNIDFHDQPSRMHRFPPRSRQNFPIQKIQRFDKSDRHFRFDDKSVLIEIKVIKNDILINLYLRDELPILHCSPSGSLQS